MIFPESFIDKLRKWVKIPIIAQLIERFSAQMMLFDAICADYFWIFCGKNKTNQTSPTTDEARFFFIRLKIIPSAQPVAAQSQQSWLQRRLSFCVPCRRRRQEHHSRSVRWRVWLQRSSGSLGRISVPLPTS